MNVVEEIAFDIRYHVKSLNDALTEAKAQNVSVYIDVRWNTQDRVVHQFSDNYNLTVQSISRQEIL